MDFGTEWFAHVSVFGGSYKRAVLVPCGRPFVPYVLTASSARSVVRPVHSFAFHVVNRTSSVSHVLYRTEWLEVPVRSLLASVCASYIAKNINFISLAGRA